MEINILRFSVGNMNHPSLLIFGMSIGCEVLTILMIFGFIVFWKVKTKATLNWL